MGLSSLALNGMQKLRTGWWQKEGNIGTIQDKSTDQVCICSVCKVCMLISTEHHIERLTLLLHIQEVPGSNLDTETDHPD
jgi:hypothetical protein